MHRIYRPLAALSAALAVAGGALAFAESASAAGGLGMTLSAQGDGSSAVWNSAGDPVLTVGLSGFAKATVDNPAAAAPGVAPTFASSAITGNSPHWVIQFAGGDSLIGTPSMSLNAQNWTVSGTAGGCPSANTPDTYMKQLAFVQASLQGGCGGNVTSAFIIANVPSTVSVLMGIQYDGQTLPPGPDMVTVAQPGAQSSTVGTAIATLQMSASSSKGDAIAAWSAAGLPDGLSIDKNTGAITGTPTTAGNFAVTVTAADNGGTKGSVSFAWSVSNAPTGPGTTYSGTIRLVRMGLCLDDRNNSSTSGAIVQVWRCNGLPNQNWQVMTDGTIRHNGLCLDAKHAGTADRTPVQLWACTGKGNQKWDTSGWRVHYDNPNAFDKVLDDTAFGGSGTQQEIFTNNGGINQIWATF